MPSSNKVEPAKTQADRFAIIVRELLRNKAVTRSEKKGFGSNALWTGGKIFAMLSRRDEFVVKLPKERVDELVDKGEGKRFDTGKGRLMKEWFVSETKDAKVWLSLARKALNEREGHYGRPSPGKLRV